MGKNVRKINEKKLNFKNSQQHENQPETIK